MKTGRSIVMVLRCLVVDILFCHPVWKITLHVWFWKKTNQNTRMSSSEDMGMCGLDNAQARELNIED